MKAKQLLKYINELFPELITIAKDENGDVCFYNTNKIVAENRQWFIDDDGIGIQYNPSQYKDIEWKSNNWEECIETLTTNDNDEN